MAHGAPRRDVPSLAPRAMAQYGARLEEHFSYVILVTSCFVLYCRRNVENTYAMIDTLYLNKMQALLFEDKLNENKIIQKDNPKTKSQM